MLVNHGPMDTTLDVIQRLRGQNGAPLSMATYFGLIIGVGATICLAEIVMHTLRYGNEVLGDPSLLAVILLLGGTQLVTMGIIGEYLARVFNEVKGRPLYLVEQFQPSNTEGHEAQGSGPATQVAPTGASTATC